MSLVIFALIGLAVGLGISGWVERMCQRERQAMKWPAVSSKSRWKRCLILMGVTAVLFSTFTFTAMDLRLQDCPEVQPSGTGRSLRVVYHLALICLLIVATATDFDSYLIPDQITLTGLLIGVGMAVAVRDLQLCHLWVDWHYAVPHLRGPMIPAWYDAHRGWHAVAWSCTGAIVGAAVTWIARMVSSRVLGQEAMGLGDVTLMAMIGSFLGWQAVLMVFLLAPIAGLTVGVMISLVSGKTYLPYGPWLSLAALFVLFFWSWLWERTRLIFSDWLGLGILAGTGTLGFVALLGLVRLYRAIPTRKHLRQ